MELLVAVSIIVVLGLLAQRFGYDSRDGMRSKEYDLARCGVAWDTPPAQAWGFAPAAETNAPVRHAVSEPPMRLALLKLSPAEFAALANDLGPDGAAAFAATQRPDPVAVRRAVRASAPLVQDGGEPVDNVATRIVGGAGPIVATAEMA